ITTSKVASVARLVKTGEVISLAHAVPQKAAADVPDGAVFHRTTLNIGPNATVDNYQVSYHGLSTSHMDAFCHQYADGQMYNGFSVHENVTQEAGCKKGSVMEWRDGIIKWADLYELILGQEVEWIDQRTSTNHHDEAAGVKKS